MLDVSNEALNTSNIVHATIAAIDGDSVQLTAGDERWTTSRADAGNAQVGSSIDVYVDTEGAKPFVSKRMADALKLWDDLARAAQDGSDVEGEVVAVVKGGLTVDVGMRGFLPASQATLRPTADLSALVGQRLKFRVLELDARRGRLVVSRRALLEAERAVQREAQLAALSVGDKVSGTIISFVGYGAFVDIGSIDALLRLEDMSWGHVRHGSQLFAEGDTVQAKVLDVNRDKGRVAIGVKHLTPDPWAAVPSTYPVGTKVRGTVLRLAEFGAFVEIEPHVEALLHVSEMTWDKNVRKPSDVVQKGQRIECVVLDVDARERRMALGLKQLTEDPWVAAARNVKVHAKVTGKVTGVTDFGAFVEIAPGLQGLCHITEMTDDRDVRPADIVKVGDELTVTVLDIDPESHRIALSVLANERDDEPAEQQKPFSNNPFADKLSNNS